MFSPQLPRLGTFDAWRTAARALASNDVPAHQIDWVMEGEDRGLFAEDTSLPEPRDITVPKDFLPLAKLVCASRVTGAHDMLYRVLLRCRSMPQLLRNRADPDVNQLEIWAKSVRRDMHKMKAFVRFRDVTPQGANRRHFLSWFEPDHRIEELIAPFFAKRFGDMDWVIVTPEVTTRFEKGAVQHETIKTEKLDLSDDTEELWRTYYANIFNPARLKIKAMQSEMPKKYWKNLPEADLIPGLIQQAEERVRTMHRDTPTLAPARAERILNRLPDRATPQNIHACARCPIGAQATQPVLGTGPLEARLMIVGEQPGDQEDLAGTPFVGPAGQLFDKIALEAGLDRSGVYMTNAVKHFKYVPRGKRRVHQSPNGDEINACRIWLTQEIQKIQPVLIMALGATAAQALTGNGGAILTRRGKVEKSIEGLPVLISLHPSAVLRRAQDVRLHHYLRDDLRKATCMVDQALHASLHPDPQTSMQSRDRC